MLRVRMRSRTADIKRGYAAIKEPRRKCSIYVPDKATHKYLGAAPDSWDWEIGFARDATQFKLNRF